MTALVWLALTSLGAAAQETSRVFATYKDQVAQIQLLDVSSEAKAGIGSGFAVDETTLVTNFHVVSELIYKPERYRAVYEYDDGRRGVLTLRAIDVVHDLAILTADTPGAGYFELSQRTPEKGERLYAFGNPHDLGLTIVEGTYNGLLEKSMYEKIHFTASINPGMSGGPTVDAGGRVVGVNVSTAGNQLSFLVPVEHVRRLVERARLDNGGEPDFLAQAAAQLLANQAAYVDRLLALPEAPTRLGEYVVQGRSAPFLSCWGDTQHKPEALYDWVYQTCATTDVLFLSGGQTSGVVSFTHELFSTKALGAVRFNGLLEERFQIFRAFNKAEEDMVGRFECKTGFVEHEALDAKVVFCLRAYTKLEGLFDAYMKTATLSRPTEALQSTLGLAGVSFDNAVRVSRAFLESIRWTP